MAFQWLLFMAMLLLYKNCQGKCVACTSTAVPGSLVLKSGYALHDQWLCLLHVYQYYRYMYACAGNGMVTLSLGLGVEDESYG